MSQENSLKKNKTMHQSTDGYYLPDLNKPQAVLGMLLSIEVFVAALALIKFPLGSIEFFSFFAGLSMLMIWVGIVFAVIMHFMKSWLMQKSVWFSTLIQLAVLLCVSLSFTYLAKRIVGEYFEQTNVANALTGSAQQYYINNIFLCLIIGGLLLRYFYIAHQNQRRIKAISSAQIQALQSRIRPHFLFNSLNSIASLIRIDQELAEQSVEDLSDLFRASLSEESKRVTLKEELEIARLYQRIEQIRLGDRLQVKWNIGELPLRQTVPVLIIQPLLENAVYHGIEPLTQGGKVTISAGLEKNTSGEVIIITVENPLAQDESVGMVGSGRKHGNQIAMSNIEQRLRLRYGDRASVQVEKSANQYKVSLRFPSEENSV